MLLRVENLTTSFQTPTGVIRAVDQVSFDLEAGKTLGIVGESGSGKTVTALSMIRLIQKSTGRIESGKILFNGTDLLSLSDEKMRAVRGNKISMIFQEPMTSLNPVFTVGDQIIEAIVVHQRVSYNEAKKRCLEIMELVGIPDVSERFNYYPHQLSGGLRQRIMIAMALSCRPQLLIADEPTTALDVTIQAQILSLMKDIQKKLGMAIVIITHDFGVVAEMADDVAVMYAGRVIEKASVRTIFSKPAHPYTTGLQNSLPYRCDPSKPLPTIPGIVPDLRALPPGCRFSDRCAYRRDHCQSKEPSLFEFKENDASSVQHHLAACYYPLNTRAALE